jgi:hypothetical protein
MRLRKAALFTFLPVLAAGLLGTASPATAATFVLVNTDGPGEGFNDPAPRTALPGNPGTTLGQQRLNVFQAAAAVWGTTLRSDVPISIDIQMNPLPCNATSAVLGGAAPTVVFRDFTGAPLPATWFVGALADSLAGVDLDAGTPDEGAPELVAQFNSSINGSAGCLGGFDWWYGVGAPAPNGTIDFFTVVLHEIAHGLGFTTVVSRANGEKLLGFDDSYMVNLEDHSTGTRWPAMTNGQRLASQVDDGDLHWVGPHVVEVSELLAAGRHPSAHVQMYAPNPVQVGSSVTHFDTDLTPNELMEPFLSSNAANLLTTELLRDVGWQLEGTTCVPSATTLCIDDQMGDRRFAIDVTFDTVLGGGVAGNGRVVNLNSVGITEGGLFWFFDSGNPEILVKVLNGCALTDHYWVFYAATTNVGFTLTVTDTQTGNRFLRVNPDEVTSVPVQDTFALPCN